MESKNKKLLPFAVGILAGLLTYAVANPEKTKQLADTIREKAKESAESIKKKFFD